MLAAVCAYAEDNSGALYVFYPSVMRPSVVQQKIVEACGDLKITVFGRFQDFKEKVEADRPGLIITKPEVLQYINNYRVQLAGFRDGRNEEPCLLLSIDRKVDLDSIPEMTIGAVDFLGKSGMEKYMAGLMNRQVRLNRVVKIEDLLPMLTFNKARAVLAGEGTLEYIRKTTSLKIAVTEIPSCNTGIIVCAVNADTKARTVQKTAEKIRRKTAGLFQIDEWKRQP